MSYVFGTPGDAGLMPPPVKPQAPLLQEAGMASDPNGCLVIGNYKDESGMKTLDHTGVTVFDENAVRIYDVKHKNNNEAVKHISFADGNVLASTRSALFLADHARPDAPTVVGWKHVNNISITDDRGAVVCDVNSIWALDTRVDNAKGKLFVTDTASSSIAVKTDDGKQYLLYCSFKNGLVSVMDLEASMILPGSPVCIGPLTHADTADSKYPPMVDALAYDDGRILVSVLHNAAVSFAVLDGLRTSEIQVSMRGCIEQDPSELRPWTSAKLVISDGLEGIALCDNARLRIFDLNNKTQVYCRDDVDAYARNASVVQHAAMANRDGSVTHAIFGEEDEC
ncbi:hypothetical protein CEUSTIGMA_g11947.t1 [Chlamydomonas eustigma]|uniref:Uncharacterized protein n=1 Tax=Chlamydomonas eustigma TaxID=1157962 RepID=A0A250XND8_9CHLO|nr:hypothetical protein CEUSTIGMA_g11947.t1 [Chlamydomonas eustigma]|eukprot:GAX84526.1 hypothetical protein CEUSTIGMA_g11947.t1 [Chlamydomonas eustigma]